MGKWCRRYYLNSEFPSCRVLRIDGGGEGVDGSLPFFGLSATLPQVNSRLQDRRESSVSSLKETNFWQEAK